MNTTVLDLAKVSLHTRMFITPFTAIYVNQQSGHPVYTIHTLSRNGVVDVVQYVPRDIYPGMDKVKKVSERIEVHFKNDNVVYFDVRTAESGDEVIEIIGQNITDPSTLVVRDSDGFIKLTPYFMKARYFHDYRDTEDSNVRVYGAKRDDYVTPNLVNACSVLYGDRVRVNYIDIPYCRTSIHGSVFVQAMDYLKTVSEKIGMCNIKPNVIEAVLAESMELVDYKFDGEDDLYC
ncbi:MAG: hypothetical protein NC114_06365 [Ruminococcus flavefaciens]|nr:hypothetical protein [Ruminococcus flavefaciens]